MNLKRNKRNKNELKNVCKINIDYDTIRENAMKKTMEYGNKYLVRIMNIIKTSLEIRY